MFLRYWSFSFRVLCIKFQLQRFIKKCSSTGRSAIRGGSIPFQSFSVGGLNFLLLVDFSIVVNTLMLNTFQIFVGRPYKYLHYNYSGSDLNIVIDRLSSTVNKGGWIKETRRSIIHGKPGTPTKWCDHQMVWRQPLYRVKKAASPKAALLVPPRSNDQACLSLRLNTGKQRRPAAGCQHRVWQQP